jgi:hypothetical protein
VACGATKDVRAVLSRLGIACVRQWDYQFLLQPKARRTGTTTYNRVKKGLNVCFTLTFFLLISAVEENILCECQNPHKSSFRYTWLTKLTNGHNV